MVRRVSETYVLMYKKKGMENLIYQFSICEVISNLLKLEANVTIHV